MDAEVDRRLTAIEEALARIETRQKGGFVWDDQLNLISCGYCYDRVPKGHYEAHKANHEQWRKDKGLSPIG